jgi:hypothetical protein
MKLAVLEHPHYHVAHPTETHLAAPHERCEQCLLAIRPDTGELVLLWGCGYGETKNWTISRDDPEEARHRRELGLSCAVIVHEEYFFQGLPLTSRGPFAIPPIAQEKDGTEVT